MGGVAKVMREKHERTEMCVLVNKQRMNELVGCILVTEVSTVLENRETKNLKV